MKKQYLEIGQIVSTHGIKGEVRLNPWCDSPEYLKNFKTLYFDSHGTESVKVLLSRPHSNVVILKLDGIDTVEQAAALRGKIMYINRDDAPKSEESCFVQDLIGCTVKDEKTGVIYGKITDVAENPANDIWYIKNDSGVQFLFPAVKEFIAGVDEDSETVFVRPIKGIFSEAEEIDDEN